MWALFHTCCAPADTVADPPPIRAARRRRVTASGTATGDGVREAAPRRRSPAQSHRSVPRAARRAEVEEAAGRPPERPQADGVVVVRPEPAVVAVIPEVPRGLVQHDAHAGARDA